MQVQSVPILTGQGGPTPDVQKVWRQQMKWILLWLTLSLLTCLHSAALMLATQYNVFATVRLPAKAAKILLCAAAWCWQRTTAYFCCEDWHRFDCWYSCSVTGLHC